MNYDKYLNVDFFKIRNINRAPPNNKGLVAIGGSLNSKTLLCAYSKGIFPWFDDDNLVICWWYLSPRMVLFPDQLKISRSLSKKIRNTKYLITFNIDFKEVIKSCALSKRNNQIGTWITVNMQNAYLNMYKIGFAVSFEYWEIDDLNNKILLAGLYGIKIGNIFFGESMFTKKNDASKIVFVHAVKFLQSRGVILIDCQMKTSHLSNFGAVEIPKKEFDDILSKNIFFNKDNDSFFQQHGTIINNY